MADDPETETKQLHAVAAALKACITAANLHTQVVDAAYTQWAQAVLLVLKHLEEAPVEPPPETEAEAVEEDEEESGHSSRRGGSHRRR